jgi:hypothetical protein
MLEAALNQKIKVKEGERERNATGLAIGLEQLANQFARGDRYVFELAERTRSAFLDHERAKSELKA